MADRSADEIQRDIEQARAGLAEAVDQLAYRTNPKRLTDTLKEAVRERANSPQGRVVIGVAGGLLLVVIVRRIRKH